ncbi:hypothetical protein FE257_003099 [Aspergillus nanangensis]|uniref:Uncharacterized protein n=1 Tax=Aspergillus nanangensis TaxID=2582783 RepID=A0AAD4CBY6_ASPNN|nr:hypothetical protein FE257_003099 [Aspergillus nanangensis]
MNTPISMRGFLVMTTNQVVVAEEMGVQGRFQQHIGDEVTAAFVDQAIDLQWGDFEASIEAKTYKRKPDVEVVNQSILTGPFILIPEQKEVHVPRSYKLMKLKANHSASALSGPVTSEDIDRFPIGTTTGQMVSSLFEGIQETWKTKTMSAWNVGRMKSPDGSRIMPLALWSNLYHLVPEGVHQRIEELDTAVKQDTQKSHKEGKKDSSPKEAEDDEIMIFYIEPMAKTPGDWPAGNDVKRFHLWVTERHVN